MTLLFSTSRQQILTLIAIAVCMYLPFSGKPFHIDSPVTIYIANQLLHDPLNPPAGDFGPLLWPWNQTELPTSSAFRATPHPPLLSLYTAPFIHFFGANEHAINWVFFPFYLGSILLLFNLCGYVGIHSRFFAALLFTVSPVLFVNAQNVMYDVPLAFFSIGCFERMFQRKHMSNAILAGLFAGCACLTKFTAGTICIAGFIYYLSIKQWRLLIAFTIVVGVLNGIWFLHNLYYFDGWQLTQNGHASYIIGDIRYRFERMIAYIGAGYLLPVFPLGIWFLSKQFRKTGWVVGFGALIWSLLMILILHYSIPAALFYWLCSFAGGILLLQLYFFSQNNKMFPNSVNHPESRQQRLSLVIHTSLQIIGGLFLTLYAVRYTLAFIYVFIIISVVAVEKILSPYWQRRFWVAAISTSFIVSILLSINDFQIVTAEKRIAGDLKERYPSKTIYFKGRLGYLYYMYKAGAKSLTTPNNRPVVGDLVIKNCFYSDDGTYIAANTDRLHLIDSLSYPLFSFKVIGGRAGFYGNDRLPYALDFKQKRRVFNVYEVTK